MKKILFKFSCFALFMFSFINDSVSQSGHFATLHWMYPKVDSNSVIINEDIGNKCQFNLLVTSSVRLFADQFFISRNSNLGTVRGGLKFLNKAKKPKGLNIQTDSVYIYSFSGSVDLTIGVNNIDIHIETELGKVKAPGLNIYYVPPKPNLHVLSIGVPHLDLQFTQKDATDFANLFEDQHNKIYRNMSVRLLNKKEKTQTQKLKWALNDLKLDYFKEKIKEDDVIVLFISSHGFYLDKGDDIFIMASDFSPLYLKQTTLNFKKDILAPLSDIGCRKLILLDVSLDSFMDEKINSSIFQNDFEKTTIISACSIGEVAYEHSKWDNGAFAKAILDASKNQAASDADKDGVLTNVELFDYLKKRVPEMVGEVYKGKTQQPVMWGGENDEGIPVFYLEE